MDQGPGRSIQSLRAPLPPHMGELMTSPMRNTQALVAFALTTYVASNFLPLRGAALVGLLGAYYMYNDEPGPARRQAGNLARMRPADPLPPSAAYR